MLNGMRATPIPDGRPPVIAVEGLTKRYGSQVVVDGLSLDVPRGVVAGFIGPNGAGKTTTMAMLLGLVRPTSGTGTVLEFPLDQPAAYLGRVGALVEGPAFWPGLTGVENLRVVAELGGHDPAQIPELLDLVRLSGRGRDRFGQYSLGMKQRLGIAAALVGDPELLVLDEPTNGLDPAGINEMRDLIAEISHDDRTVLVSSHLLSEVEQVCDWLIVIDHGALRYQGPADGFLAEVTPVLSLAPERLDDLDRLAALVRTAGFDADRDRTELTVRLDHDDPRSAAVALNKEAINAGITLAELHVKHPSLESHYLATLQGGDR
jgi:ABC-2 type transport system ATP-binding protein